MSNQNSSSSYSYSSSSFSSSSFSSTSNGQTTGTRSATHQTTNPSGTTTHTLNQNLGEPAVIESRRYDDKGRELIDTGYTGAAGSGRTIGNGNGRVEDVTESEADRVYREKMENEYAKREGGA
ncbi:hypothetical protein LTS18_009745 [Coniosporium uncinatum]|uniref:Uncharacterized protein n=1 Tax=Coniosporium uncinatum TaxID=93489 RepID=A0ACC3D077_9PEZI|nr:hypothetical protein LTS18_009745 [Coniosporium uncinatum]